MSRLVTRALAVFVFWCWAGVAAHAEAFLSVIDDVPLPEGLVEASDPVVFESQFGRVVEVRARGVLEPADIRAFYHRAMPALGWMADEEAEGVFVRASERLSLRFERLSEGVLQVRFELLVKPARFGVPDAGA